MLKSILLAGVLALTSQTTAMAQEPSPPQPTGPAVPAVPAGPHRHVKVFVRECAHEPWRMLGCYECIHDAQTALAPYQAAGYQVSIR